MNQIVADASFCGAWILADEASERADLLLDKILAGSVDLVVPGLWHFEINNMLRSALRRNRLSREDAWTALETLECVPVMLVDLPDAAARKRILHLALQFQLSSYDAAYLELADRLKAPLHSSDKRLVAAASLIGLVD